MIYNCNVLSCSNMQFFSEKLMDHVSSKLYIGGVNQHLCQLSVNILVTISVVGVGQDSVDILAKSHFTVIRALVKCQSMTVGCDSIGSLLAMHMLVICLLSIRKLIRMYQPIVASPVQLFSAFQLAHSIHISAVADNG